VHTEGVFFLSIFEKFSGNFDYRPITAMLTGDIFLANRQTIFLYPISANGFVKTASDSSPGQTHSIMLIMLKPALIYDL